MWIWSKQEQHDKLLKSVQKWLEYKLTKSDTNLSITIAEHAFRRSHTQTAQIMELIGLKDTTTEEYLAGWIQLGYFAGYLAGHQNLEQVQHQIIMGINPDKIARYFASNLVEHLFRFLTQDPVSPLVDGLKKKDIELLRICEESSLYAGFRDGVETASNPQDTDKYQVN